MIQSPRLDLHVHTTHSDGSLPTREVVALAHKAGVTALAITDHDITAAIPEALAVGRELGVEIIPGVEISSCYLNAELHILGYFFDWHDAVLIDRLSQLRASRHARNPQIIQKLNEFGLDLTYEEVTRLAGTDSVGRPHIARVLLQKGYVTSTKEAFERFLAQGKPAYVPRTLPDPVTVIQWIREAHGIPVMAHPSWAPVSGHALQQLCRNLRDAGLGGIEVFYSTHTTKQTGEYLALARQVGLLPSGGSDFHGAAKPDIEVGIGRGDLTVPFTLLEPLRAAAHG